MTASASSDRPSRALAEGGGLLARCEVYLRRKSASKPSRGAERQEGRTDAIRRCVCGRGPRTPRACTCGPRSSCSRCLALSRCTSRWSRRALSQREKQRRSMLSDEMRASGGARGRARRGAGASIRSEAGACTNPQARRRWARVEVRGQVAERCQPRAVVAVVGRPQAPPRLVVGLSPPSLMLLVPAGATLVAVAAAGAVHAAAEPTPQQDTWAVPPNLHYAQDASWRGIQPDGSVHGFDIAGHACASSSLL